MKMARKATEKELLKKIAEVDELKKKLDEEESQKANRKKKSKWPLILGGIFAFFVVVAMIPEPEPLSPEEVAEKKAQALKSDTQSTKSSLEAAISAKNDKRIIEKYEALRKLDQTGALEFSADYEDAKAKVAEAARLRKLNNLGNFYISNYVDEFGDKTGQKFIGYKGSGKFSNSATEGSALSFWLAINSPTEFDVALYEYAGKNPVKDVFGGDAFVMRFRYADVTGEVTCKNSSDRISCGPSNSARLIDALRQANQLKFSIYNQRTTSSQYSFIVNANGFSNALRKLQEN